MKPHDESDSPAPSLSIIVPLYNEEESVSQLHARLTPVITRLRRSSRVQLILVDDGSEDATAALLREHFGPESADRVHILRHPANRGLSAAMRTGFAAAEGELVATLDCDCSYDPDELPAMIHRLLQTHADIITASPYHPAVLTPETSRRLLLSRACSRLYRFIVPDALFCYTSFFRVYRREWALPELSTAEGFLGVTEHLVSASYCGAAIIEHPTPLGTRRFGRSKMRTFQVIRAHLGLMGRMMLLNCRLNAAALLPSRLAEGEGPLYGLGDARHDQLQKLEYIGALPLPSAPADGLAKRLGLRQEAGVI